MLQSSSADSRIAVPRWMLSPLFWLSVATALTAALSLGGLCPVLALQVVALVQGSWLGLCLARG